MALHNHIVIGIVLSVSIYCNISCNTHQKAVESTNKELNQKKDQKEAKSTQSVITRLDSIDFEFYKIEFYPPNDSITTPPVKSISKIANSYRARANENTRELTTIDTNEENKNATRIVSDVEYTNKVASPNWLVIIAIGIILIAITKLLKR